MLGIVAGIIALAALGCIAAYAVIITIKWLICKIKEKIEQNNAKKVAVGDLREIINNCENKISLAGLESYTNKGYTHVIATVNDEDEIDDVEIIKDENIDIDAEVEKVINQKGNGMVVIEG